VGSRAGRVTGASSGTGVLVTIGCSVGTETGFDSAGVEVSDMMCLLRKS
jgi:hypothetical protein